MAESAKAARPGRWRRDLALVVLATVGCFAVSVRFELHERLVGWLGRYERWQIDELGHTLVVLALGLAWYAARRMAEGRRELAGRRAAEARAAELLGHNRELSRQLIAVQERERLAIARELHDELAQGCSAIRVETACLRRAARDDADATVLAAAARADLAAQTLLQQVRAMLRRLRPADLDALGLVGALRTLCDGWQARTGLPCDFDADALQDVALPEPVNITVYRIVQESLTNVQRHAKARSVKVTLAGGAGLGLRLRVADDGIGLDPAALEHAGGLGLLGCSERAAAAGGTLSFEAVPGGGLALVLTLPAAALAAGGTPGAPGLQVAA